MLPPWVAERLLVLTMDAFKVSGVGGSLGDTVGGPIGGTVKNTTGTSILKYFEGYSADRDLRKFGQNGQSCHEWPRQDGLSLLLIKSDDPSYDLITRLGRRYDRSLGQRRFKRRSCGRYWRCESKLPLRG